MELQEPVLQAVHLSLGWRIPPRFPDVRGAITDTLLAVTEEPDYWMWRGDDEGKPYVAAWNDDKRLHVVVDTGGIDVFEETADPSTAETALRQIAEPCAEILNIPRFTRWGSGATWTLAAEGKKSAQRGLERWLHNDRFRTILEPFGGRPDSEELDLEFGIGTDTRTGVSAEAFSDEGAAEDGPFFSHLEVGDFPPGLLVVEVLRRHKGEAGTDEATGHAVEQLGQLLESGEKLLATVGGESDDTSG